MSEVTFNPAPPAPSRRGCLFCRITIPETNGVPFCGDHRLEFEERQRNGVATNDLDTRWGDRLGNWRECPTALDGTPHSELLRFTRGAEPWVIFMRGYPNRLPDWVAIDIPTGHIRWFVEINKFDLADDLGGRRPALNQGDLNRRWGNPEVRESRESFSDRYTDVDGNFSLYLMIDEAQIPVYGVSENPLGLKLGSSRYTDEPHGPFEVELNFVSPDAVNPTRVLNLISTRADVRRIKRPPQSGLGSDSVSALNFMTVYKPDLIGRLNSVAPISLNRHITLPGIQVDAEIINWAEPINLFSFSLQNEEIILSVSALGLSEQELFQLLGYVKIVNSDHELLDRYQADRGF